MKEPIILRKILISQDSHVCDLADFFINEILEPNREYFMYKATRNAIQRLLAYNKKKIAIINQSLIQNSPPAIQKSSQNKKQKRNKNQPKNSKDSGSKNQKGKKNESEICFDIWKHDIVALGDEHAIHCGFQEIENYGTIQPIAIPGLSIFHLRRESHSPLKTVFWNRIQECYNKAAIILILGDNDIKYVAPKMIQKKMTLTATETFMKIAALYNDLVEQIHKIQPNLKIFIHSIFINNSNEIGWAFKTFNEVLERTFKLSENAKFLNVQSDISELTKNYKLPQNSSSISFDYQESLLQQIKIYEDYLRKENVE